MQETQFRYAIKFVADLDKAVELGVPATEHTLYEIGSMTKQFTAEAVMLLVNEGKLGLDDPRIVAGIGWLLSMRQQDGGWAIPLRTHASPEARSFKRAMSLPAPLEPDRRKPSSHLVTGIVLRALAAHPKYRKADEARAAARVLASRLFQPDTYPDRRAAAYWKKLRYPFRWTDIISALDALLLLGADPQEPAIAGALRWLIHRQDPHGLWRSAYAKAADYVRPCAVICTGCASSAAKKLSYQRYLPNVRQFGDLLLFAAGPVNTVNELGPR